MIQEIEQVTAIYDTMVNFMVNYSFQIIGAIFIFLIGLLVARKVGNVILKLCGKHQLDTTLSNFIASVVRIAVVVMVAIMALSKVGISVTPLLATIGALSLGAGLAIQGLVSNYGAGLNIIITRPYVVGDTIEVNGAIGLVTEVHLGFTVLVDEDEVKTLVPNRHIVGEVIKNSQCDKLIEVTIGLSYDSNPEKALKVIDQVLEQSELLSKERPLRTGIDNFGPSNINLGIRAWAPTKRYYSTRYKINQMIYNALQDAGFSISYPQREVRLVSDESL